MARLAWFVLAVTGVASAQAPRAHVVFMLGADQDAHGFFTEARQYFHATDPDAQIVTDARSLAQVREELKRRAGVLPWGRIVLVAHGTQWTGLVVPLFDAQTRATLASLRAAASDGEFPPLPSSAIDAETEFVVESCGLGRRADYLADLVALFVEDSNRLPRVRASRDMVWFGTTDQGVALRRELPYRAQIVRGKSSTKRSNAIAAKLRADLATEIGSDSAVSTMALPIRVHIIATSAAVAALKDVESYVRALPAASTDLGGAGLAPSGFVWRRVDNALGVAALTGEATLVLTMQSAPEGASSLPQALELR